MTNSNIIIILITNSLQVYYSFSSNICHFFSCIFEKSRIFAAANDGTVAQLVEQRTENPRVTGSIPVGTTPKKAESSLGFFCDLSLSFSVSHHSPHFSCDVSRIHAVHAVEMPLRATLIA